MLQDIPPRRRWPRSQRFILSEKGETAEADYRSTIIASRDDASRGRDAFDAAREQWARTWGVQTDDGLYLGEVKAGPKTLEQLVAALENCDKTKQDAIDAVGRTFDAGLLTTAPEVKVESPHLLRPRRW